MFAGDDETDGHHGLTDYELERVAHIRRNREIMRQLGLGDHDIVTAARARCGEKDVKSEPSGKRRKTEKRNRGASETVEAGIERVLRRSRRLLNTPTSAACDPLTRLPDDDDEDEDERRIGHSETSKPLNTASTATRRTRERTRKETRDAKRASPWWARRRISTR